MLHARLELDSTLDSVYKLDSLDRETRQLLDSRQLDTQAHAVSLDSLDSYSTGARQARQARPRQRLDSRLDSASTEPRQLDSSTARAQNQYKTKGVAAPGGRAAWPGAVLAGHG